MKRGKWVVQAVAGSSYRHPGVREFKAGLYKGEAVTDKANEAISLLTNLDTSDMILVLEFMHKYYPHRYDYATMPSTLRRFYDPSSVRPEAPHDKGDSRCFR